MIPTVLGITLISFLIIHLAPGKPTDVLTELNPKITPEAREKLEKYYGLDKPVMVQYGIWLKRIVKLDFGDSFSTDQRPIGVSSATRQYSLYDKMTTVAVFIGFAIPTFWFALLLMILFGVYLDWLPISGLKSMNYDNLSTTGKVWETG